MDTSSMRRITFQDKQNRRSIVMYDRNQKINV